MGDEEDELFGLSDPQNPDLPDTARSYVLRPYPVKAGTAPCGCRPLTSSM